jgi:N-acetylglutamate synthase-like GNAT family acetyltransferase
MDILKKLEIRNPLDKDELKEMFCLRWKVLREPWNQPKGSERDEKDSFHSKFIIPIIAIIDNSIAGTIRLHKRTDEEGQLRYLAVDEKFRNLGIGKKLIIYSEKRARDLGFRSLILNARKTATKFFQKLGYEIIKEGPLIFEVIEHYVMEKKLV